MARKMVLVGAALAAASLAQLFMGGCGGSKIHRVNVSAGEYYSEDEYAMLPEGQKRSYCEDLQKELGLAQQEFESKNNEIAEAKKEIDSIRKTIVPMEQEVLRLDAEIRSLTDQIKEVEALPKVWKVRPGDWLTSIAANPLVYNDIDKWWRIYEANQDKIFDPYYIFPDTVLVIPRDWPVE